MKRKKIDYTSSDITGKSKKYFYCPLYEACSVYQMFSCLTAICKLGRHSPVKKKDGGIFKNEKHFSDFFGVLQAIL